LNYFETILLLSPELGASDIEKHISSVKDIIAEHDAEIVNEVSWGKKKLAYLINNFSSANFHIIRAKGDKSYNEELSTKVRITEDMIRQMTLNIEESELERNFEF